MNIDEIEDRVRATVGSLDVGPPKVSEVIAEGERRRKRTRTMSAVLATVGAVVVVAGLSQVLASPFEGRAVPPAVGPSDGLISPTEPESTEGGVDRPVRVIPVDQRGEPISLSGTTVHGETVDVADFRGEVVLVPFWGSWCKPCQKSVALVDGLAKDQRVTVVGVAFEEASPEDFRSTEAEAAVSFESIFNPREAVLQGLGDMRPIAVPTTLILDSQGRVAARVLGPFTSASGLTSAIALLQQQDAVSDGLPLPNLLTVDNQTDEPIWVTFSNGNRAQVKPARQFQLGSQQACSLMPLTATTMDGTVIDTFDEPCAGQTWTISTSGKRGPTSSSALSDADVGAATAVAANEARRLGGKVDWASVTETRGTVTNYNIGEPCLSGRLLHITLAGTFDAVQHGGVPGQPYQPILAVEIVADPESRQPCRMSVSTAPPSLDPQATALDLDS